MERPRDTEFFIGFFSPSRQLLASIVVGLLVFVAGFAGSSWLLAQTMDGGGEGRFRFDWGPQTVTGILEATPYPILHVTQSDRYAEGHVLLLSGPGKRGVQARAAPLDGALITINGFALRRGSLDMIQVNGNAQGMVAVEDAEDTFLQAPQDLGRWRLTGEICDGKCLAGAMRPGTGLAHRACANLCLEGGAPPVFVSTAPVDGEDFFLLADADGDPLTEAIQPYTALPVEIEGHVERRGSLLVFRIDLETITEVQPW